VLKRELRLLLLASAVIMGVLFVGNTYAINQGTIIVSTQNVYVSTTSGVPYANFNTILTAWFRWEILPTKTLMWEWITLNLGTIQFNVIGTSGQVYVEFPQYITISSFSSYLQYNGGPGVNWITIILSGSNTTGASFVLQTNYISSQYYGASAWIYVKVNAGTKIAWQNSTVQL